MKHILNDTYPLNITVIIRMQYAHIHCISNGMRCKMWACRRRKVWQRSRLIYLRFQHRRSAVAVPESVLVPARSFCGMRKYDAVSSWFSPPTLSRFVRHNVECLRLAKLSRNWNVGVSTVRYLSLTLDGAMRNTSKPFTDRRCTPPTRLQSQPIRFRDWNALGNKT